MQTLQILFRSPAWLKLQTAVAITASLFSYMSLIFLDSNTSDKEILALFATIYATTLALNVRPNLLPVPFLFIISILLALIDTNSTLMATVIALQAAGLHANKDKLLGGLITEFQTISIANKIPIQLLIARSQLIGFIIILLILFLTGIILDYSTDLFRYWLVAAGLLITTTLLNSDATNTQQQELKPSTHLLCLYSALYNGFFFLFRYFLLAKIIVSLSAQVGMENHTFTLAGTIIGFLAIVSYSIKKKPKQSTVTHQNVGTALLLTAIPTLVVSGLYNQAASTAELTILLIAILGIEIANKHWSIIFTSALTQSEQYANPAATFNRYKNIGGALSFIVTLIFFEQFQMDHIVTSLVAVIITTVITLKIKTKNWG
ncbi:hypothetical protein [Photobacterium leiognathi]|uniref:hypothetical protein n=1 Tax=Photobacterium leiognathi TaxID=553611 RepID=UPI002980BFDE|nr:hypothetical protein [Photobacterium leiognathi]